MQDRFNTIAGWTLFAGVVGLGLSAVSSRIFEADRPHRPEVMGYAIEGVEVEGDGEAAVPLANLLAVADPAAGEQVFAKCKACHTINQGGAQGIGPNLYGIMGVPIGKHVAGFAYSSDLANHGGVWDWETMDDWLASPRKFAPGTKMSFAGLSRPEDRANVIVYMNVQGSNLPLPPPEVAPAAEGDTAGPPAATSGGPAAAAETSDQATSGAAAVGGANQPIPGSDSSNPGTNRAVGTPEQSPAG